MRSRPVLAAAPSKDFRMDLPASPVTTRPAMPAAQASTPPVPKLQACGSGVPVAGVRADALLRGTGDFTLDGTPAHSLHIAFARSPHAHARILRIDDAALHADPAVLAVFTGATLVQAGLPPLPLVTGLQRADGSPAVSPPRHALAVDCVRHVGEAVAAVVATTALAARAAADALAVDYLPLPAVADAASALQPGAPCVGPAADGNLCAEARHGNAQHAAEAFARAAHHVVLDLVNQRVAPCSLEPRALRADHDARSGMLDIVASTQMPTMLRDAIAQALPALQPGCVRVRVGDVGGGFGMKTVAYPEDIVTAHAAMQLGRPVAWQAERSEELQSALHGRDLHTRAELALDAEGRILALRLDGLANVGAYGTMMGVAIPLVVGPLVATSVYDVPVVDLRLRAVLTHTAPTGAYRGAGQPEFIHAIERLLDAAARQMRLDPAELRRRNLVRAAQLPYTSAMGQTYDSGDFGALLDQALAASDWAGFSGRQAASAGHGRLRGRGVVTLLKMTGAYQMEEDADIVLHADGSVDVVSRAQEMGQGITTSLAQLAVDVLELPIARIRVLQGDTARANGFGSGGSRSLFTGGAAVQMAALAAREEARRLAADLLEVAQADVVYSAGRLHVPGTDLCTDLAALAAHQPAARIAVQARSQAQGPSWPHACHVCEVEIDPATGEVQVVRYTAVNDIGRVINPAIARGQIEGAIVQGIGQALHEAVVYDRSGQLLNGSLMDYALPRAADVCTVQTLFDESHPCRTNRLGAKGAGELGVIAATPAVANAVIDALRRAGVGQEAEALRMPMTPERVWQMLSAARRAPAPTPKG
jgi:carbon-monoxide dehydrogenase large subunit